jgi:hypothetical protein
MELAVQTEPKYESFQDQDDFTNSNSNISYTEILLGFMRIMAPIFVTMIRASVVTLFWSHIFQKDYRTTFIVIFGCFYCNNDILSAVIILVKAGVPAYAVSKLLHFDFPSTLMIIFCGWKINSTLGITVFAIYAGHHVLMRKKEGRAVGYSNITNGVDDEVPTADRSAVPANGDGQVQDTRDSKPSTDVDASNTPICYNERTLEKHNFDEDKEDIANNVDKENSANDNISSVSPETQLVQENSQQKPVLKAKAEHPGMEGFHRWMGAVGDIYRMYQIATINEELTVPLIPRSERGQVPLRMMVQNNTEMAIDVFWVDYRGNEEWKGHMGPFVGNINITTWIGHPWAFREKGSGKLVLHYVPFRIIPTIEAYSIENNREDVGHHRFSIMEATNTENLCGVQDDLFPYPPSNIQDVIHAVEFSIQQMERERVSPRILLKYLQNIALHPDESKYRQIRVANKVFWSNIWCNGGRGVLHALGFEEHCPCIEMGPNRGNLLGYRVKDLSNAIILLEEYLQEVENTEKPLIHQPRGADGSGTGRANWRM